MYIKYKVIDDKFCYDFGFGDQYYTCECGSHKINAIHQGGMIPPKFYCDDCATEVINTYRFIKNDIQSPTEKFIKIDGGYTLNFSKKDMKHLATKSRIWIEYVSGNVDMNMARIAFMMKYNQVRILDKKTIYSDYTIQAIKNLLEV